MDKILNPDAFPGKIFRDFVLCAARLDFRQFIIGRMYIGECLGDEQATRAKPARMKRTMLCFTRPRKKL
jgi:hypothetical protein